MVFEVDNTTEQLINQLQESIQATIYALEDGQREIKDLIEDVKQSSASLATSAQADLMSEDVSKVKVAIQKLATAEQLGHLDANQGKLLGVAEQVAQATEEFKSALPKMGDDMERQARAIMDAQSESENRLELLLTKLLSNEAEARVSQLQTIVENLNTLSQYISAQVDKLSSETSDVLTVAKNNRDALSSIVGYLSLPGYKRFFKGMEVPRSETAQ